MFDVFFLEEHTISGRIWTIYVELFFKNNYGIDLWWKLE